MHVCGCVATPVCVANCGAGTPHLLLLTPNAHHHHRSIPQHHPPTQITALVHQHERAQLVEWAKQCWEADMAVVLARSEVVRTIAGWQELMDPECGTTYFHNPVRTH